jgi:dihydroorotate dehydrogenase
VSVYERVLRPVLFRTDAEVAHTRMLRLLSRVPGALVRPPRGAARTVFGVRFPNPVGLAAGMDKDGVALRAWPAFGFGFVEVGTVTRHAQPGNPRPRLFRLTGSAAVVNRMGFNNAGAHALAARLARYGPLAVPLGISLGKSKVTPLESAVEDYLDSLRALYPYGDYFAVNVSSPNTPRLRTLQDAGHLDALLGALRAHAVAQPTVKPILVKIAPDLTEPAIADLLAVCERHAVAGIIATNTTTGRPGTAAADPRAGEAGGLSGAPLFALSRRVVEFVHAESGGRLPVVAVGGIATPDDAARMFDAGAALVQLYTALIYRGPAAVRAIARTTLPAAATGAGSGGDHRVFHPIDDQQGGISR